MAFRRAVHEIEEPTVVETVTPAARRVQEEYVTEAPPQRTHDIWGWLVAALFAAAAIGLLFWGLSRTDTTRVPAVVGLPVANAAAQLRDKGFDPVAISVPSKSSNGTVLRQVPGAGAQLEAHAKVGIVAANAATVKLPKLVGLKVESATRLLTTLKVTPQTTIVASDKPKGTILAQDPAAGATLSQGDPVQLTVAKGPNLVAVPALRGLAEAKAVAQLQALGLTVITHEVASPEPPNTVVAQSPAAGTKLKPGARVNVNVASAAASKVTVPDVVGLNESDALAAIQQAGLKADLVSVAGAQDPGTIVRQDPAANAQVAKGDTVRISSSDGSAGNAGTTVG
jgi:serine/threonine-protein kinase